MLIFYDLTFGIHGVAIVVNLVEIVDHCAELGFVVWKFVKNNASFTTSAILDSGAFGDDLTKDGDFA